MKVFRTVLIIVALCSCVLCKAQKKVVAAYVTSWSTITPDPAYLTQINYAFGHVNDTFNGVRIANQERFRKIVALKKEKSSLKVVLSIGGWGSGGFSEVAEDANNRKLFAKDCRRIVRDFGIDGIDIDWEYPTSNAANISASPSDKDNFTLLLRDIRKQIGKRKLLTIATVADAKYINFKEILPYVDFVNIMSYDMDNAPYHHSGLYRSQNTGHLSVDEAVKAHIVAGVSANKLVMGIPFYGRGSGKIKGFNDYKKLITLTDFSQKWDKKANAPYLVDETGTFVCGYDNPQSITAKCNYIIEKGLHGAMYWDYDGDDADGTLRKAVYNTLIKRGHVR